MKLIPILAAFTFLCFFGRAQNFFYIGNKNATEKSIREELIKASQYVTKSPLASDYIITASVEVESGSHILNLKMSMQDSITFKTLFQSNEDYTLHTINANTEVFLRMTIAGFIEKNISQIIVCAQDDHYNTHGRFLKARKDKT
ncbi:MAG TPA: hypothetical protein VHT72_02135 [Puia sp.]|nr:hypothetical protein [Puia sp.]